MDDTNKAISPRLRLLGQYQEYADVSSTIKSDELPLQREYNHQIQLNLSLDLGYCPFYWMTELKTEAFREYTVQNLDEGFIATSNASYASTILMVKKADSELDCIALVSRLCILTLAGFGLRSSIGSKCLKKKSFVRNTYRVTHYDWLESFE